jgi:hypothetical protein
MKGSCGRPCVRENTCHLLRRRVTVVAFNLPPTHVAREKERERNAEEGGKREQKRHYGKTIKYSQAKNIRSFIAR